MVAIDHSGHTSRTDVNDILYEEAVGRVENQLNELFEKLPENHTLIVMGDHGCRRNGKHGGNYINEQTSVFFMYSNT